MRSGLSRGAGREGTGGRSETTESGGDRRARSTCDRKILPTRSTKGDGLDFVLSTTSYCGMGRKFKLLSGSGAVH